MNNADVSLPGGRHSTRIRGDLDCSRVEVMNRGDRLRMQFLTLPMLMQHLGQSIVSRVRGSVLDEEECALLIHMFSNRVTTGWTCPSSPWRLSNVRAIH